MGLDGGAVELEVGVTVEQIVERVERACLEDREAPDFTPSYHLGLLDLPA
jgi:hypothetical protein